VSDAPDPTEVRLRSPLSFAERWTKFSTASRLLLGAPPPSDWFESEDRGLMPDDPDPSAGPHPYSDDDPPAPPFKRKRTS
jgi:hypothetical protein